jgi:glycosyltransferase involved in cell wall biosynthesis
MYLRTDIYRREIIAGGSVSHTIGVVDGFAQLGYRVLVASSCMKDYFRKSEKIARFASLHNPRILHALRSMVNCLFSNIFFTIQLLHFIKKEKVEFIYQRYSLLNCSGVLIGKLKKIPLVLEYNGSETWVQQHWAPHKKIKLLRLIDFFERINLKHATHIIVVSQALKTELCARGISAYKILVNPNGVDPTFFDPYNLQNERIKIRAQHNITNEDFVIGFSGTFNKWHGIELLADIVPSILQKNKSVFFIMVGDGPLFNLFKEKLSSHKVDFSRIIITGLITHECARDYLAACDAFMCPTQPNEDGSRFFGSPTKLFEYMSLEKPIIASNIEQLAHVVKPTCGLLATSSDAKQFVGAITDLVNMSDDERKKMGRCARAEIVNYYSWQQHVKRIDAFLKGEQ